MWSARWEGGVIEECLVVEFRVTGDDCPLAAASRTTGTTIDAHPPQRRADGTVLLRFSAPTDESLSTTLDSDERVRYLHAASADGRTNYRCLATAPCVAHQLTDAGLLAESLRYREGIEHHTGAVIGYKVLRNVLEAVGKYNAIGANGENGENGSAEDHETTGTDGIGITVERVYPLGTDGESSVARRFDLTRAQELAIERAFEMGYFAVPRECTATDVADVLDIGKSAFLERLRRGQTRLFAGLFP